MGFQKDMSDLAKNKDISALDAMLGMSRILFQRAAEDPESVSEDGLAACMASLAKVASASSEEANWGEIRGFFEVQDDKTHPPQLVAPAGSASGHSGENVRPVLVHSSDEDS